MQVQGLEFRKTRREFGPMAGLIRWFLRLFSKLPSRGDGIFHFRRSSHSRFRRVARSGFRQDSRQSDIKRWNMGVALQLQPGGEELEGVGGNATPRHPRCRESIRVFQSGCHCCASGR